MQKKTPRNKPARQKGTLKRFLLIASIITISTVALVIGAYFACSYAFDRYFIQWGDRLVAMERKGLLSHSFGAAWQDVLSTEAMKQKAAQVFSPDSGEDSVSLVDGVRIGDYPSLSIVARLNEIRNYSNSIDISDRLGRPVALIRTDHVHVPFDSFPPDLVTALVSAEDGAFWTDPLGFRFRSYTRAVIMAVINSITRLHPVSPQGTSTITQQVAKLLISRLDSQGRRYVGKTIDRKLREMRLAAALHRMYSPREILEVYMNHCVTSDYGLIGFHDIARELFGVPLCDLSDAQCIYLARMVKWGRNIKPKITRQCRIDMPRMGGALGWDQSRRADAIARLDTMTFRKPNRVQTDYGILVDCANEYWLQVLRRNGFTPSQIADMDIVDPNSLIRKKGNVRIRLTMDLALQKELELAVRARGYGPDTIIVRDVRIGSTAEIVTAERAPRDILRQTVILKAPRTFSEPGSGYETALDAGDTVFANIRYKKDSPGKFRKSSFYYISKPVTVDGQYYAYSIMDSRTGELLAYYSRDRIGSRLAGLTRYTTPNGSSTAKPLLNALNFDMGNFLPYQKWNDSVAVDSAVAWKRSLNIRNEKAVGVIFQKSAVKGKGYVVQNHGGIFDGCQYLFDQLNTSNNILGVECAYRLDQDLFSPDGSVLPQAFNLSQYLYRLDAFTRLRDDLRMKSVTGVRLYKELARITGASVDSVRGGGKTAAISDSLYSIALGTLELTLYQQMHLFNALHNNDLVQNPADHPSLVIQSIILSGDTVPLADTIRRYHPFSDINNIRPTLLGLHKRLVANAADGLTGFDIALPADSSTDGAIPSRIFDPAHLSISEPLSFIAKSGTSDDIIRPFNVSENSDKWTNYGLWNAVIRIDMGRLSGDSIADIKDLTIACLGECNEKYTGARDGKTLHKFITNALLKKAGVQCNGEGYFARYEAYLRDVTPADMQNCGK